METDRHGHAHGPGHAPGGATYQPRTDVHEREHERFAQELATLLNDGVVTARCAGLVLVVSNPFLGRLKAHLGVQAQRAVLRTLAADYTTLPDHELMKRLAAPTGPA